MKLTNTVVMWRAVRRLLLGTVCYNVLDFRYTEIIRARARAEREHRLLTVGCTDHMQSISYRRIQSIVRI